jgi:hypothetical protein
LGSLRAVERAPSSSSALDVLDRVLDKGIVVDAWIRVSLAGIELIALEAHMVVVAADINFGHAETSSGER